MMGQIDIFGHEEKDALTYEDKIREAQDVLTLASEISMDILCLSDLVLIRQSVLFFMAENIYLPHHSTLQLSPA